MLNFEISARSVADGTVALTATEDKEKPSVSLTVDGRTLTAGTDYTVEYKISPDGKHGIVTVTGIGNYSGMLSTNYDINKFDHLTWIIPTATAVLIAGAVLVLMILKKKRKK